MSFCVNSIKIWKAALGIASFLIPSIVVLGCAVLRLCDNAWSFLFSLVFPITLVINLFLLLVLLLKKDKKVLFCLLALVGYFICFDSFFQFNNVQSEEDINSLSILTFNVQGFSSKEKEKKIVRFIKKNDPDIVLFQEFSAIKYHYFKKDYPYWIKTNRIAQNKSVLAIFSKYPIETKDVLKFPNTKNNAVYADILYNGKKVRIYNLHLESFKVSVSSDEVLEYTSNNGLFKKIIGTPIKQREQVDMVLQHINMFKGKTVICGDFNSTQFSSTYLRLKENRKDSFVEKGKGFGSTYNILGYPLRLDYVLTDNNVKVVSHENFNLNFSDHEPVKVNVVF